MNGNTKSPKDVIACPRCRRMVFVSKSGRIMNHSKCVWSESIAFKCDMSSERYVLNPARKEKP